MQPGMNFYGDMPDSYQLIINTEQPVVKRVTAAADEALASQVKPIEEEIESKNAEITKLREKKDDDEAKKQAETLSGEVSAARDRQVKLISDYAATQPVVKQLLDLALLGNGLLRGEALSNFIARSVELL